MVLGHYKKAFKSLLFLGVFFSFYTLTIMYSKFALLASMFRMMVLFLPCFILAGLLITEYNSSEVLSGLEKLKLPKIFVIGLTVTIRYIPTFKKEFEIIKSAMYIRGVKFSLMKPVRTFEYLLVPQLFRCLSLSNELTAAALTKGINAPNKRSSYFEKGFNSLDYLTFSTLIIGYGLIIGNIV